MLSACVLSIKEFNEYIAKHHRHHGPIRGDKFRVGCLSNGRLCGAASAGRPVSRYLDDGKTLEVLRLCTDGTKNACSFLYSRCARIAQELGYERIITYILETEIGSSLKASGWQLDAATCGGGHWNCATRPRSEGIKTETDLLGEKIIKREAPTCAKQRWLKVLNIKTDGGGQQ